MNYPLVRTSAGPLSKTTQRANNLAHVPASRVFDPQVSAFARIAIGISKKLTQEPPSDARASILRMSKVSTVSHRKQFKLAPWQTDLCTDEFRQQKLADG